MQVTDKVFLSSIKQVYITVYLLGRIKIMFFMQEKKRRNNNNDNDNNNNNNNKKY